MAVRAALLCCWLPAAHAGHGLMNAFAGIEWLPDPGVLPNESAYRADRWQETLALVLAGAEARPALAEGIAREKLAEAEAMLKVGDGPAAQVALVAWQAAVGDMVASAGVAPTARLRLANGVLEQQYIALADYQDLPQTLRGPLLAATRLVGDRYAALAAGLSPRERDSLFFRAEEVRWSLEMAAAADEQGL